MVAVDHLSLGIPKAECFGLLGVNGMKILRSRVIRFHAFINCLVQFRHDA